MKKYLLLSLILTLLIACSKEEQSSTNDKQQKKKIAELKILEFNEVTLPVNLDYEGDIFQGLHWNDENGENYMLLTTKYQSGEMEGTIKLRGYHYANKQGKEFQLVRKIQDAESCDCDLIAEFIKNATKLSDLDSNGYAEITIMYMLGCHCDPGPNDLKLIMLENGSKYTITGITRLISKDRTFNYKGKKVVSKELLSAPNSFQEQANSLWDKYFNENSSVNQW